MNRVREKILKALKDRNSRRTAAKLPFFVPTTFVEEDKDLGIKRVYHNLGIVQRVFLTFESSVTSQCGKNISIVMMCIIMLSCINYVASTTSVLNYQPSTCDAPTCIDDDLLCPNKEVCAPQPYDWSNTLDFACVIIFLVEYSTRILTVSSVPARLAGLMPKVVLKPLEELMMTKEHPLRHGADHSSFYVAIHKSVSGTVKMRRSSLAKAMSQMKGIGNTVTTGFAKKGKRVAPQENKNKKIVRVKDDLQSRTLSLSYSASNNTMVVQGGSNNGFAAAGLSTTDVLLHDAVLVHCSKDVPHGEIIATTVGDRERRSSGGGYHRERNHNNRENKTDEEQEEEDGEEESEDKKQNDDDLNLETAGAGEGGKSHRNRDDGQNHDKRVMSFMRPAHDVTEDEDGEEGDDCDGDEEDEEGDEEGSYDSKWQFEKRTASPDDADASTHYPAFSDATRVVRIAPGADEQGSNLDTSRNPHEPQTIYRSGGGSGQRTASKEHFHGNRNDNEDEEDDDELAGLESVFDSDGDDDDVGNTNDSNAAGGERQQHSMPTRSASKSLAKQDSEGTSSISDLLARVNRRDADRETGYERSFLEKDYAEDDPKLPWYQQIFLYSLKPLNIIDALAIWPAIATYAIGSGHAMSLVRVLRFCRIFRILKVTRDNKAVEMLGQTLGKAFKPLVVVAIFVGLGVIIFGCLGYHLERGTFTVTADYPNGVYVRTNMYGTAEIVSNYVSIPAAMYWAVITSTTVGFGDLYPTSILGRMVACACMYIGVLLLALPITVIGANFNREYNSVHGDQDELLVFETLTELATLFHEESLVRAEGRFPDSSIEHVFSRVLVLASVLDNTKRSHLKGRLKLVMDRLKAKSLTRLITQIEQQEDMERKWEQHQYKQQQLKQQQLKLQQQQQQQQQGHTTDVGAAAAAHAGYNGSSRHAVLVLNDFLMAESFTTEVPKYTPTSTEFMLEEDEDLEDLVDNNISDLMRTLEDAKIKRKRMRLQKRIIALQQQS